RPRRWPGATGQGGPATRPTSYLATLYLDCLWVNALALLAELVGFEPFRRSAGRPRGLWRGSQTRQNCLIRCLPVTLFDTAASWRNTSDGYAWAVTTHAAAPRRIPTPSSYRSASSA